VNFDSLLSEPDSGIHSHVPSYIRGYIFESVNISFMFIGESFLFKDISDMFSLYVTLLRAFSFLFIIVSSLSLISFLSLLLP